MAKHENNGKCQKCIEIIEKYPGFYKPLRDWFANLQTIHPELHVSCAGRGMVDQEAAFQRGASRAHYQQSAHNWGCALDLFALIGGKAQWPKEWFNEVVGKNLAPYMEWYGSPDAAFYELPHVQLSGWKVAVSHGELKLVRDT